MNPANDDAVWAFLGLANVPVLCTRKEANAWWNSEEVERAQIKYDEIDGWKIDTRFWRFSLTPDGPPLFWRVSWFTGNIVTGYSSGERHFGTMQAALEFHAAIMATIRKGGVPDGTSEETGEVAHPGFVDDEDEGETRDAADWWKDR